MGVKGFTSWLETHADREPEPLGADGRPVRLVVDGSALAFGILRRLGPAARRELGGDYDAIGKMVDATLADWKALGYTVTVVADGPARELAKEHELERRRRRREANLVALFEYLSESAPLPASNDLPSPRMLLAEIYFRVRRALLRDPQFISLVGAPGEADPLLASLCRNEDHDKYNVYAVSTDSDFLFMPGILYVPFDSLSDGYGRVYSTARLAAALRVPEVFLPEFAVAIGNDFYDGLALNGITDKWQRINELLGMMQRCKTLNLPSDDDGVEYSLRLYRGADALRGKDLTDAITFFKFFQSCDSSSVNKAALEVDLDESLAAESGSTSGGTHTAESGHPAVVQLETVKRQARLASDLFSRAWQPLADGCDLEAHMQLIAGLMDNVRATLDLCPDEWAVFASCMLSELPRSDLVLPKGQRWKRYLTIQAAQHMFSKAMCDMVEFVNQAPSDLIRLGSFFPARELTPIIGSQSLQRSTPLASGRKGRKSRARVNRPAVKPFHRTPSSQKNKSALTSTNTSDSTAGSGVAAKRDPTHQATPSSATTPSAHNPFLPYYTPLKSPESAALERDPGSSGSFTANQESLAEPGDQILLPAPASASTTPSPSKHMGSKRPTARSSTKKATVEPGSGHSQQVDGGKSGQAQAAKAELLPVDAHRDVILRAIAHNRVTIIHGETGSGKSSRVPLMLLEEYRESTKIMVSQPRRIAARALCERTRSVLGPQQRGLIGLRLGGGVRDEHHSRTQIWYVTTGYLVRKLAGSPESFDAFSHLILDEIHERSVDMDILCLLAKRMLETNPKIRLVLMSATLQAELFTRYFELSQPPVFVGRKRFPLTTHWLDSPGLLNLLDNATQQIATKTAAKLDKLVKALPAKPVTAAASRAAILADPRYKLRVNTGLMRSLQHVSVKLVQALSERSTSAVLVFVSGIGDIAQLIGEFDLVNEELRGRGAGDKYKLFAIHSSIPYEEQLSAWDQVDPGVVKVVVATNSAESSITLPDVDFVICFGTRRQIEYDVRSDTSQLVERYISHASAEQRAGRTARTRPGVVFRLYTPTLWDSMEEFDSPEIHSTPLDKVILDLKSIVDGPVIGLLRQTIDPPSTRRAQGAFDQLAAQGLLTNNSDETSLRTDLGMFVSQAGLDIRLGVLIKRGFVLGALPEAVALAAVLSMPQSPYRVATPLIHKDPDEYHSILSNALVTKLTLSGGLHSEPLGLVRLLAIWQHEEDRNFRREFCALGFLAWSRVHRLAMVHKNLCSTVARILGVPISSLLLPKPDMVFQDPIIVNKARFLLFSSCPGNIVTIQRARDSPFTDARLDVFDASKHHVTLDLRSKPPHIFMMEELRNLFPSRLKFSLLDPAEVRYVCRVDWNKDAGVTRLCETLALNASQFLEGPSQEDHAPGDASHAPTTTVSLGQLLASDKPRSRRKGNAKIVVIYGQVWESLRPNAKSDGELSDDSDDHYRFDDYFGSDSDDDDDADFEPVLVNKVVNVLVPNTPSLVAGIRAWIVDVAPFAEIQEEDFVRFILTPASVNNTPIPKCLLYPAVTITTRLEQAASLTVVARNGAELGSDPISALLGRSLRKLGPTNGPLEQRQGPQCLVFENETFDSASGKRGLPMGVRLLASYAAGNRPRTAINIKTSGAAADVVQLEVGKDFGPRISPFTASMRQPGSDLELNVFVRNQGVKRIWGMSNSCFEATFAPLNSKNSFFAIADSVTMIVANQSSDKGKSAGRPTAASIDGLTLLPDDRWLQLAVACHTNTPPKGSNSAEACTSLYRSMWRAVVNGEPDAVELAQAAFNTVFATFVEVAKPLPEDYFVPARLLSKPASANSKANERVDALPSGIVELKSCNFNSPSEVMPALSSSPEYPPALAASAGAAVPPTTWQAQPAEIASPSPPLVPSVVRLKGKMAQQGRR